MDNTNIFKHSNKEFVTDAFLTWLLYFLNSEDDFRSEFFNTLLLKETDKNKSVRTVKVSKQKKRKHGRPDLVLTFKLDNDEKKILFENKTYTTTTRSQLSGYRKDYDNIYRYFYLKLAYINIREKLICKKEGYDIISSKDLYGSIIKFKKQHKFIEQYADYLKYTFIDKINDLEINIFEKGDFKAFADAQGQQIFVSALYQKLADLNIDNLVFKTGSSAGRPWTELDICSKNVNYKSEDGNKIKETIFWRVDIRANKYYLRLNQYSYKPPKDYLSLKKKRLTKLRELSNELVSGYKQLSRGKVENRGNAESEIVIFFEDKNTINHLLQAIPSISKKFIAEYNKLITRMDNK